MTLLTDVDYRQHKQGTAILPLWHLSKQTYYALYYSDWCFFTNVSFVNATLKYSKCVNYCNLWCKPQELPCPETSRLNRLHQQLINKHVASLDRVIQGYAAYGFRHLFRHSLKVTLTDIYSGNHKCCRLFYLIIRSLSICLGNAWFLCSCDWHFSWNRADLVEFVILLIKTFESSVENCFLLIRRWVPVVFISISICTSSFSLYWSRAALFLFFPPRRPLNRK